MLRPHGELLKLDTSTAYLSLTNMSATALPMFLSALLVASGGAIGALARWLISLSLNSIFPLLAPGTLVVNYIGAFLMGLGLTAFNLLQQAHDGWRLLLFTGFLGGLTTFSSFTAEVMVLIQNGRIAWGMLGALAHVGGSLVMFALGMAIIQSLKP